MVLEDGVGTMELSKYVEYIKKNIKANEIEFDIGVDAHYKKEKLIGLFVNDRSSTRIKFKIVRK